jgi:Spy/CpxP family protein refolding chaperone
MKAYSVILALVMTVMSSASAQNPKELLSDPKSRDAVFAAIIGDHELMLEFLNQARKSDHAKMMISHIMGDQSSMEHGAKSPYTGEESRTIKSLSFDDIAKYRDGEGMGLAKVAELNHYPGPKHVLSVASHFGLSKEQQTKAQGLYDAMHTKAVRIGSAIIQREEQLDRSFADGTISQSKLADDLKELGRLQGELRLAHVEAHLGMKNLLTKEQILRYDEARGYHDTGGSHQH